MSETETLAEAIIEAAGAMAALKDPFPFAKGDGVIPHVALPDSVKITEIEKLLPSPVRARGTVTFTTLGSFIAYYQKYAPAFTPLLTAKNRSDGIELQCTFDYHDVTGDAVQPEWGQFIAVCKFPTDLKIQGWLDGSGRYISQADFANLLELRLKDIVAPDAATMLEVVSHLEATKNAHVKSHVRLATGAYSFGWDEDIKFKAGIGATEVPFEFTINVPLFRHGPKINIPCKIRYSLTREDGLNLAYLIMNIQDYKDKAFEDVIEKVETETKQRVYWIE